VEVDLECLVSDIVETSAKRAIAEMDPEKRAAFDAAISAKVDAHIASLTVEKVGQMVNGNIVAVAVGHLRLLVNQQVESGKGVIVEAIQACFAEVFHVENVKALVKRTLEDKAQKLLHAAATDVVNRTLSLLMGDMALSIAKKAG
jgi:hypothetical protein